MPPVKVAPYRERSDDRDLVGNDEQTSACLSLFPLFYFEFARPKVRSVAPTAPKLPMKRTVAK